MGDGGKGGQETISGSGLTETGQGEERVLGDWTPVKGRSAVIGHQLVEEGKGKFRVNLASIRTDGEPEGAPVGAGSTDGCPPGGGDG